MGTVLFKPPQSYEVAQASYKFTYSHSAPSIGIYSISYTFDSHYFFCFFLKKSAYKLIPKYSLVTAKRALLTLNVDSTILTVYIILRRT